MTRAELVGAIERQRDAVLDGDIVVAGKRSEAADAERERARDAAHLAHLLDLLAQMDNQGGRDA